MGGGIIGLAVAVELARRHPRLSVSVLEKEDTVGRHQTGHNSGVIHAGIYYAPGSLKARLCVEGARALYDFCDRYEIAHERCGKVILATREDELPRLDELERRGVANGVPLSRIGPRELEPIEPHARALAGLHSPVTGIVDFAAVARRLALLLRECGGSVVLGCEVRGVSADSRAITLAHTQGEGRARHAVFCAGAWADRLAMLAGASPDPRIVAFRGAYLRLRPERRALVRGLIYPVPDPALPFLGVHLSRHIDGEVLIGPTALIAGARDAYAISRIRPADLLSTLAWPGTWRLVRRFWRTGANEVAHALIRRSFVAAASRYVPKLRAADVVAGPAGVRGQALGRDGRLVDDFAFSRTERALHVRNAPSPAATSSLAIARMVADEADAAFELRAQPGRRPRKRDP